MNKLLTILLNIFLVLGLFCVIFATVTVISLTIQMGFGSKSLFAYSKECYVAEFGDRYEFRDETGNINKNYKAVNIALVCPN